MKPILSHQNSTPSNNTPSSRQRLSAWRRAPVFTCVAASFALAPVESVLAANTWVVNTCVDAVAGDLATHTGSLRFATNNAASGDTVDMSSLACVPSTISLQMGAVTIRQNDLTLNGPGVGELMIARSNDAGIPRDRIFRHSGHGTLTISNVSVANGYVGTIATPAAGGCIYSMGELVLDHVNVSSCTAKSQAFAAWGGGVYSSISVTLKSSTLRNNRVDAVSYAVGGGIMTEGNLKMQSSIIDANTVTSSLIAVGGGAWAFGSLYARNSTVSNNAAVGSASDTGGGISVYADLTLVGTTISGNTADVGGGISQFVYYGNAMTAAAKITNSTISGNHADKFTGGIVSNATTFVMQNSTVAFNTAAFAVFDPDGHQTGPTNMSPGVALLSDAYNNTRVGLNLRSSILSNNTFGPPGTETEGDVSLDGASRFVASSANNLIRSTFPADLIVPPGVVASSECPLLGPLRDNGGPTLTHALLSHSPALDAGDNSAIDPLTSVPFIVDQRGFPRVDHGIADIGAFEVQQGDLLFSTAFEGCL